MNSLTDVMRPGKAGARYAARRRELETYFDRTAAQAWARLTSDEKVSRVRATVRAGRDAMRALIMSRLGEDLQDRRLLDAGCGTGALAAEAAARGAAVTAIDLSPTLVGIARERCPAALPEGSDAEPGRVSFLSGDMLDDALGTHDHVVAMDSLIHYQLPDIVSALSALAPRTRRSIVFTVAPSTPMLTVMHAVGKLFPKGDKSPAIEPARLGRLSDAIGSAPALSDFEITHSQRIASGFYTSQCVELTRR